MSDDLVIQVLDRLIVRSQLKVLRDGLTTFTPEGEAIKPGTRAGSGGSPPGGV